jgi:hypothetical protein
VKDFTLPDVKTINLFVEQYHHATLIDWPFAEKPKFEMNQYNHLAHYADIALHALQDVLVQRECMAEYPADWIEALKERFAPAWFLRRWPVRKARIDMQVLYPRIAFPRERHTVKIRQWTPDDYLPSYSGD